MSLFQIRYYCKVGLSRISVKCGKYYSTGQNALLFESTEAYLENLVMQKGRNRELKLSKYFENNLPARSFIMTTEAVKTDSKQLTTDSKNWDSILYNNNFEDLVNYVEEIKEEVVPNSRIKYLLVFFSKNGNINGVKAVQFVVKKYNISYFYVQSEYKHYLAEALWVDGQIENSLELFSTAYNNSQIRPKVKFMLSSLFPLLISQHTELTLNKTVRAIEKFSVEKEDPIILAYLWKELFQSDWFSDQQLANNVLKMNTNLVQVIQWMIPAMGKDFLRSHKIENFHRLIELSLVNDYKMVVGALLRLLFDYYYVDKNIERCSAVVKYSSNLDFPLTEDQQRRFVNLLLKGKNAVSSKRNIKEPQNLKFKF